MKEIGAQEIFEYLCSVTKSGIPGFVGDQTLRFKSLAPVTEATIENVSWVNSSTDQGINLATSSNAGLIIAPIGFPCEKFENLNFITVPDPKLGIALVTEKFFKTNKKTGVHKSAVVDAEAIIGKNVYIGANAVVGKCRIGDDTEIHPGVIIYDNVVIGKKCLVRGGTVVGVEGFNYVKNEDNEWQIFHHVGGVEIGDNVHIGSNTSIYQGTLENTIIKDGVKIDCNVVIGHNVKIERNAFVIANSVIGGSSKVGEFAWIAPGSTIKNKINIGKDAMVGIGSTVIDHIDEGAQVMSRPAMPVRKK